MLDEAFETLLGDAGLAKAMEDDEKQWDWITKIESKLEELMIMRVSPEMVGGASTNNASIEDNKEVANPNFYDQLKKGSTDYKEFLQFQTMANKEKRRRKSHTMANKNG
jgi:hypothetical protein